MFAIFLKEINSFFSSLIGYIAIAVFLVLTGLVCWVFPTYSILVRGFSDLMPLFNWGPIILILLIPAITMRSFSEEFSRGTIELLLTKPITDFKIIAGKYLAALVLVAFSILPTLIYYYTVIQLSNGDVDHAVVWGSYIGLMLLAATFIAVGMFASSVTDNQIVAFILAAFLCFFFYLGFDYLSELNLFFGKADYIVQLIGMYEHFKSIQRGVIDTRDIVYFLSIIALFMALTKTMLESRKW